LAQAKLTGFSSGMNFPINRLRRKQLPRAMQASDDCFQTRRSEKGLHPHRIEGKMRIAASLISASGRGTQMREEKQRLMLNSRLSFDSGMNLLQHSR
jgi:hypothetical protein